MIEVNNISKFFGDVTAVEDLSFKIDKGEIVGMLGPNGAGKTTTMRVLTGYLQPDKGDVIVNGISIKKNPIEALKLIGYLPENNPLYKDMLVSEFLVFSAELKGLAGDNLIKALDYVSEATKIKNVFYRPIKELSKGYKQRVGIAAALIHKPEILILDEPTEGLDPTQRIEIRDLIKDLSGNHTVLISTHVLQEAESMCTRIIVISNGHKVADDAISNLKKENKGKRIIWFETEGSKVKETLKDLKGVEEVVFEEIGNRIRAKLLIANDTDIQPVLFDLAKKNDWKVWELAEKGHSLEEIFEQLTK
ncbi:ATP-binding cassette domain-containing protein [candidate division WWE3 bacterium]|jgi:ABC-2 type transport system ATP-binding protein|uniref:ATP-binding cassette domain-containing protein n=1 Tax=candidate division WWE3 bacterium TaxID=2053526 RepID=A0A3A4ZCQ5_UNCKA|nr:MAG: ATP-binding cassette domain-containing protein [candidate division WWE3 bacterium]